MVTHDSSRENRWPTPREFVDDWDKATDNQRLARAERILQDAQAAHACFVKNHDGLQDEVEFLWSKVARVEALGDRWGQEGVERGPDDMVYTSGVAAMIRAALEGGS